MKFGSFSVGAMCLLAVLMTACHAGSNLTQVKHTTLLVDASYDGADDQELLDFMRPYTARVDSIMTPVVGRVATAMWAERPEGTLSNLLADILVWSANEKYGEKPVMALYNMGGIRASLAAGDVTVGDVLNVAPFENKICFLTLTGSQMLTLFSQIAANHGEGVSHGVEMTITRKGGLVSARLHGKSIVPDATYRIATIDYLAHGNDRLYVLPEAADLISPQTAENNLRNLIEDYFRYQTEKGVTVTAKKEGRIVYKD